MEDLGYSDTDRERSTDPTRRQRVEGLEIRYHSADGSKQVTTEPFTMIICAESNKGKPCEDD